MADFGSQVIEIEWLSNLVSELARGRHGFELIFIRLHPKFYFKIHGGATFEITEFEMASSHGSIGIEEFYSLKQIL
jgi:hypothetical protein